MWVTPQHLKVNLDDRKATMHSLKLSIGTHSWHNPLIVIASMQVHGWEAHCRLAHVEL